MTESDSKKPEAAGEDWFDPTKGTSMWDQLPEAAKAWWLARGAEAVARGLARGPTGKYPEHKHPTSYTPDLPEPPPTASGK